MNEIKQAIALLELGDPGNVNPRTWEAKRLLRAYESRRAAKRLPCATCGDKRMSESHASDAYMVERGHAYVAPTAAVPEAVESPDVPCGYVYELDGLCELDGFCRITRDEHEKYLGRLSHPFVPRGMEPDPTTVCAYRSGSLICLNTRDEPHYDHAFVEPATAAKG